MSTASTTKSIQDYLSKPAFDALRAVDDIFPGLSVMLVAVAGQTVNEDLYTDILEPRVTATGTVKGRSRKSAEEDTVKPEAITGGEKFYLRPNGDKYFPRTWGDHEDVGALRRGRETSQYAFFYGAPGCGKTALVEAAFGEDLYVVLGTGDTETGDLVGSYVQTADKSFVWVDGPLIRAAEEGKPLLIDEIGLVDSKVLAVVYSLMDGRRELVISANPQRGTVKAQEGFYVIGATNPNAPGVRLSEALLSRFSLHVEMTTDLKLARTMGCGTEIVNAATNLNRKVEEGICGWAPQFRELLAFRDIKKAFGEDFAIANLIATSPMVDRDMVVSVMEQCFGLSDLTNARI